MHSSLDRRVPFNSRKSCLSRTSSFTHVDVLGVFRPEMAEITPVSNERDQFYLFPWLSNYNGLANTTAWEIKLWYWPLLYLLSDSGQA